MTSLKPVVAISSCLLGHRVRYDGEIKSYADIIQHLQLHFELLAVCPEVEIGLSVPRPAVQLTGDILQPRMTGRDDPQLDVTDAMRNFCHQKPAQLDHICAYIFKSKSPSCGLKNISVLNAGKIISSNQQGLFAKTITELWPNLPVCDETELQDSTQRQHFIASAHHYSRQKKDRT